MLNTVSETALINVSIINPICQFLFFRRYERSREKMANFAARVAQFYQDSAINKEIRKEEEEVDVILKERKLYISSLLKHRTEKG